MFSTVDWSNISVFMWLILGLALFAGVLSYYLKRRNNEKPSAVFAALSLAGIAFIIGALTELTKDQISDTSIPPSVVFPKIVKFELGYKQIVLKDYDGLINTQQKKDLRKRYTPKDSIFFEDSFVSEINTLVEDSGYIGLLMSRRYSGEELYAFLESALHSYGLLNVWYSTTDRWVNSLGKNDDANEAHPVVKFVSSDLGRFLHGAGIFNATIGGMIREDISYKREELFDCDGKSLGLVKWKGDVTNREDQSAYIIAFNRWQLPIHYHFGGAYNHEIQGIAKGFADVIDRGCTEKLRQFLVLAREQFLQDKRITTATIRKVNDYYLRAVPSILLVSSIILNPGKYGAAVSSRARLVFDEEELPSLELDMADAEGKQNIVTIPDRVVKEVLFYGELPEKSQSKYASAFRSGTTKAKLEVKAIGGREDKVFESNIREFSDK